MTTPIERTRAIQRAREQRAARKYMRAFDAAEGGDLFHSNREESMPRQKATESPAQDAAPGTPVKAGRLHKATYARDNRKGGYMIRVEGPNANRFAGREVPVTTRSGDEHPEKLISLIWTGKDQESGFPVALYSFESKPRGEQDELPF